MCLDICHLIYDQFELKHTWWIDKIQKMRKKGGNQMKDILSTS